MGNYLNIKRIKKRKIAIFLFLIMHQFTINAHALNFGNFDQVLSNKNNPHNRNNKIFKNLLVENINNGDSILTVEDINDLEKFVDETFDQNNFDNQTKNLPLINNNSRLIEKEIINYQSMILNLFPN